MDYLFVAFIKIMAFIWNTVGVIGFSVSSVLGIFFFPILVDAISIFEYVEH